MLIKIKKFFFLKKTCKNLKDIAFFTKKEYTKARVGSAWCTECDYFEGIDYNLKIVKCNFINENYQKKQKLR